MEDGVPDQMCELLHALLFKIFSKSSILILDGEGRECQIDDAKRFVPICSSSIASPVINRIVVIPERSL